MSQKQRLDHYLCRKHPDISRGFIQKLIATDQVLVNGEVQKSGFKVSDEDAIKVLYDFSQVGKVPEIELPILFEDDNILVVDKPAGVLSHALTRFHTEPSVASFLRQRMKQSESDDIRFGIVHRLDRITSGVMICAKNHDTLVKLQKQFADRTTEKTYNAIVTGEPDEQEAIIDIPIERNPKAPATYKPGPSGKSAQTYYKVLKRCGPYSLLELKPKTGRTHQIRVHLQYIGHPVVGDVVYSHEQADRLYLHASHITLTYNGHKKTFSSELPQSFRELTSC